MSQKIYELRTSMHKHNKNSILRKHDNHGYFTKAAEARESRENSSSILKRETSLASSTTANRTGI